MATTVQHPTPVPDLDSLLAEFKERLDRLELSEAFRKAVEIGHWHGEREGRAAARAELAALSAGA